MRHPGRLLLSFYTFHHLYPWRGDLLAPPGRDESGVGAHIGYPWTAEMISLATKYPNVYIDTSAYKASRYPRDLIDYLRGHGRRKVLFGSNHPAWPAADCLRDFASLQLDDEAASLFLHGNAERVFGLAAEPGRAEARVAAERPAGQGLDTK